MKKTVKILYKIQDLISTFYSKEKHLHQNKAKHKMLVIKEIKEILVIKVLQNDFYVI